MVIGNRTTVFFPEGLLKLSNVHDKVKIFEIIESRKLRGNADDLFGLNRLFTCINIPDKILT